MPGFVAHLDADCFYASAERVRHRELVGRPVGVLGNNGACVIAKSYEMKAKGVKTGTPIWDAKVLCPEGVYVKRDFHWYEVLSRKMLAIVGGHTTKVEYYSIDEFFFEALPLDRGQHLQQAATSIRDHIREVAGLPVTIGIARTRTLAKLFSDTGKPFGAVAVLSREHEREMLAKLPVNAGLALNAGEDLFQVCDAHSSELAALHTLLYAPGQYYFRRPVMARFEAVQSDLLVLDYVILHPQWRGLRLGLLAIRRLVDVLGAGCGLAVSHIAPVRHGAARHVGVPGAWLPRLDTPDERREATVSLRRYFRRMGFVRLGRTKYYALPLNLVTPTAAELLGGRAPDL